MILPNDSLQMIVVTTPDWDSSSGTLQFFERNNTSAEWQAVDGTYPVVVGRNGLGWGDYSSGNPIKQEGDGKTPAGLFYLNLVFGYSPLPPFLKMPYVQAKESLICVDDTNSMYYNQLIDTSKLSQSEQGWQSYETMKRVDTLYQWGIVVNYNTSPVIPHRGSCIFLHLWHDSSTPTAGCTAMSLPVMEKLLMWLDFDKRPFLVQLPYSEFMKSRIF
jgi:D-alanyl-D-alanine dipeptidase